MAVTVNLGRVQPIYRGPYSPSFPYRPLDFVTFDGVTYYCIKPVSGTAPPDTEFWVSILQLPLGIAAGGTGAITAKGARTALGATSIGDAVFTAADGEAARGALGASAIGGGVFTAEDQAAALATIGGLAADGSVSLTGNLAAGGNRITGMANGVGQNDAVVLGQLPAGLTPVQVTDPDDETFGTVNGQLLAQASALAVNTDTVLAAVAGGQVGAVGTYAWLTQTDPRTPLAPGDTAAASDLHYSGIRGGTLDIGNASHPVGAGTWEAHGASPNTTNGDRTTIWKRIL